ncbi:hypothetical protein ACQR2B_06700 [Bradyrhizobium oligotrophicum]|uniref:hypothetical protein n=1 Tax=Bradyrhizobium TaxID=374 RepID=UPI003EBD1904
MAADIVSLIEVRWLPLQDDKVLQGMWSRRDMGTSFSFWRDCVVDPYGEDAPNHVKATVYNAIAILFIRSEIAARSRMAEFSPGFGLNAQTRAEAPGAADQQRIARARAAAQMSLTAAAFGDPSPG